MLVLHLGGEDSLSHLTGIHGVHLNHMEYIATDADRSTIPWVQRENSDGSETVFTASALNGAMPKGERRTMDCIDCHNRAAHTFCTAEEAINRAMADGAISPDLPWIHKEGLELLNATYASQDDASAKIPAQLEAFYRASNPEILTAKAALVKSASQELVTIYCQNVFPDMKVTWGTHPNNIGHMGYPGCFRCHDGDHVSKTERPLRRTARIAITCWRWKKPSRRCYRISACRACKYPQLRRPVRSLHRKFITKGGWIFSRLSHVRQTRGTYSGFRIAVPRGIALKSTRPQGGAAWYEAQ